MIDKSRVIDAAEKAMEGSELFLVDVTVSSENEIEVEVDSSGRMSIDECSDLNRKIESALDRDREDFSLAVYSSGVGYPFKVFKQYLKAIGKPVCVKCTDGRKIEGELLSAEQNGEVIRITVGYDCKEKVEGEKRPCVVHHEDQMDIVAGMTVEEIITIR